MSEYIIEMLGKRIAGDIVWSGNIAASMRKWRVIFKASQSELAKMLDVAPSVINSYEKGKRVPGARFVKRYVEALLRIDSSRGWAVARELMKSFNINIQAIIDMSEFDVPVSLDELVTTVKGIVLNSVFQTKHLYGYTIIDSIEAIQSLSGNEFWQIMGSTTERVLLFTKVGTGRSPMIAVRVAPVKPAAVVLHGTRRVDPLAISLADKEAIPLILSTTESVEELVRSMRDLRYRQLAES
ncbi:MAG: helix-turn-helix domain-containing protein [Sulfolobales archaeon]